MSKSGVEKKYYYPREPFWAFWQKRQLHWTVSVTEEETVRRFYNVDGWLQRIAIERSDKGIEKTIRETEYRSFWPNGLMMEKEVQNDHGYSRFTWDREGMPQGGVKYDRETRTETRLYPNGKWKIRHNRSTGLYEEFFPDGKLKRKGLWVNTEDGTIAEGLNWLCTQFETGNMRAKKKDKIRQEYIEAINVINDLPPTSGRKVAKEALVKAYKESCRSRQ